MPWVAYTKPLLPRPRVTLPLVGLPCCTRKLARDPHATLAPKRSAGLCGCDCRGPRACAMTTQRRVVASAPTRLAITCWPTRGRGYRPNEQWSNKHGTVSPVKPWASEGK